MGAALQRFELTGTYMIVFQKLDDPYFTDTVVTLVNRMGAYINTSQAAWLILKGDVTVDGEVVKDPARILKPGQHEIGIYGKTVVVDLRESESQ